jgi:hypothetical protein
VASGRVSRGRIGRGGLHAMEPPYVLFLFLVVMRGVGLGTRTSELVCVGGLGLGYPNLRFVIGFSSHFPGFIFICGLVFKYSFQPNVVLYVFPRAIQCHFQGEIELA